MRVAITCKSCGERFASMEAPTARELRTMLQGSPFAAMAGFLPPNVAAEFAQMPIFVCATCSPVPEDSTSGQ